MTAYYTDVIVELWEGMFDSTAPVLFLMGDKTEEDRQEALQNAIEKSHKLQLDLSEQQYYALGGPYITGAQFTIADCCIAAVLANIWKNPQLEGTFSPLLAEHPNLTEYLDRISYECLNQGSGNVEAIQTDN